MAFKVTDFINEAQDGARPTLFLADIKFPSEVKSGADVKEKLRFLIKATQIPASNLGMIELPFMGRKIKIAGDRTFEDWSTTIINDEKFAVRAAIEEWSNSINGLQSNVPSYSASVGYRSAGTVTQYSARGNPIRTYTFQNIWPSVIAGIDVGWESTDAVEEFEVTWTYDYFTVKPGSDGVNVALDSVANMGISVRAALGLEVSF
jgi:hypothetical protein